MTTHDLIKNHKKMHPSSHFFDRNTLAFFGEEISEMMVLPNKAKCTDSLGKEHTCYVLSSLQENYPAGAKRAHHYFDITTFEHVMTKMQPSS